MIITYTTSKGNKGELNAKEDYKEFKRYFPKYCGTYEEYKAQTVKDYKEFEADGIIKNLEIQEQGGKIWEVGQIAN